MLRNLNVIQSDLVAGSSQPGHIDEIKGFTLKKIENVMRKFFSLAALGIGSICRGFMFFANNGVVLYGMATNRQATHLRRLSIR